MTRRVLVATVATLGVLITATGCGLAPSAAEIADGSAMDISPAEGSGVSKSRPADVPADVDGELREFYTQRINWKSCLDGHFQCGQLRVPLDYAEPDGKTIELALLRFQAKDPDKRRGSLVLNPGGPGGSGVEYASYSPSLFSESVKERYDIVGFDPRGVGQSAPVECISDEQMDQLRAIDGSPDSPQEATEIQQTGDEFAQGCVERTGKDLLRHVSTIEVARDVDVLRGALGDKKLNWYGASYGTFLGATYAGLYPERVGRMVLDGGLDPSLVEQDLALGQARGFDRAVRSFLSQCVAMGDCPLGNDVGAAYDRLHTFLDDLDSDPLPASDGDRELTQALGVSAVLAGMYQTGLWADLREGLRSGLDGDGTPLLELSDTYAERRDDGSYKNNAGEVIYAVNCLDRDAYQSAAEVEALEPRFEDASPMFGSYILWGSMPCADWPVATTGEPTEIRAEGAKPILVIGSTRDPATPYEWSENLADQLESGVLLTREGDGHTSSGDGINMCVQRKVDSYLASGDMPTDGTICPE